MRKGQETPSDQLLSWFTPVLNGWMHLIFARTLILQQSCVLPDLDRMVFLHFFVFILGEVDPLQYFQLLIIGLQGLPLCFLPFASVKVPLDLTNIQVLYNRQVRLVFNMLVQGLSVSLKLFIYRSDKLV